MSDEQLIMTLAKVLIAAAWADGTLTHDEINNMKDLLFRLPQLSAREWASLAMYIETPVDDAERARLVEELRSAIGSVQDKELALATLDEMTQVDGQVTGDEEVAVSETATLLDRYRLAREFADACTPEERVEFLDVLFAVAAADGMASYDEIEEIRQIALSLKLSHKQFIDAKQKIPQERRAQ